MKKLFIDKQKNSTRVALAENGEMVEYYIERVNTQKMVGNMYKGKVVKIHPAMEIAFVKINEEKNAFLYIGENIDEGSPLDGLASKRNGKIAIKEGDIVLCQVIKDEFGTKGARITLDVTLPGRLLVMMPKTDYIGISNKITDENTRNNLLSIMEEIRPSDCGYIIRTAAFNAAKDELQAEAEDLMRRWKIIEDRYRLADSCTVIHQEEDLIFRSIRDMLTDDVIALVINDQKMYEQILAESLFACKKDIVELYTGTQDMMSFYGLTPQIEKLTKKKVVMKNGSSIIIDKVEALTVIDVNTGKYVGTKNDNLENTVFYTNMLAATEIAKQLRLRNIGGIIIVDFIDMELPEHRAEVMQHFNEQLKKDRIKTTLVGMTNLGLVELTRKKMRSSIGTYMLQQCPYCHGDGYIHSDEYVISKIKDSLLQLIDELDPDDVLIRANPSVCNKIISMKYFTDECDNLWKGKRIFIYADDTYSIEKFAIDADRDIADNLPLGANLIS